MASADVRTAGCPTPPSRTQVHALLVHGNLLRRDDGYAMKAIHQLLVTTLMLGSLPLSAVAQTSAAQPNTAASSKQSAAKPAQTVPTPAETRDSAAPPGALSPGPVVTPQITIPLVRAVPVPVDPPAVRGGKPAPVGGINDAAARCEAQADVQARAKCRDRLARETPVRSLD